MNYPNAIYEIENSKEIEMLWDDFQAQVSKESNYCLGCDTKLSLEANIGNFEYCNNCIKEGA